MSKPNDDLEAVRIVVQALDPFDLKDRERIIRWASEKLGMKKFDLPQHSFPSQNETSPSITQPQLPSPPAMSQQADTTDIKSFIQQKDPKNDNHLAAVVAYYYHFNAPSEHQKEFITKEDLIDTCRKADRKRPARPAQVLVNSYAAGLLDKGERGQYKLNSVGENLVAMVLPEGTTTETRPKRKKASPRKNAIKSKKRGSKRQPKDNTKKNTSKR